ncbi:MAG: N-acetyltransferase family protein [Bdellovibrionota bacterium]
MSLIKVSDVYFLIERARIDHLPAITEIYNDAILHTVATFDTQPKTIAEQEIWFQQHVDPLPIFVALFDNEVIGWSSLSAWSDRCAYAKTVETSTYMHKDHQAKGIGTKLLATSMAYAQTHGHRNVLARIVSSSLASRHLHEKQGFTLVGTMHQVGEKFGQIHDVCLYQYLL